MSGEVKKLHMQEVVHFLPEPLKEKINSTVQNAKDQLLNYKVPCTRRVLFLSIRLDTGCSTIETRQEIEEYLSQISTDIEIKHQIENEFFL